MHCPSASSECCNNVLTVFCSICVCEAVFFAITTLLKVNVEISTFRGRPQAQPRGRNISSSVTGRFVLPL